MSLTRVKQVDKLTPEQEARWPEWVERWTEIGLSTERADRTTFARAVAECYRAAKLEPPKRVVWVPSPIVGALAFPIASLLIALRSAKDPHVAVRDAVGDAVGGAVGGAVRGADPIRKAIGEVLHRTWVNMIGGQFWVGGWYWGSPSFVSFFTEVCGLDLGADMMARAKAYQDTASSACWWWPHRDFVMVCERPAAIHRNDRGQLHSRDGAAISWPDGWGVYSVNGVRVPADIIEDPTSITVARIDGESNAEVRRVMIEKYGLQRYLVDGNAETLHEDCDQFGHPRKLVRKMRDGDEPIVACLVKNSTLEPDKTRKDYLLRVHPELRPLLGSDADGTPRFGKAQKLTCHNAVASTFGLRGEDYRPEQET